jgi:signal peptidase II
VTRLAAPRWGVQAGLVGAGVVALDQLTKWKIQRTFLIGEGRWILDGFFKLVYVRNPGVAFGLFADVAWRWRLPFFLATVVIAVLILRRIMADARDLPAGWLVTGLVLGGAVGNLIDRLRWGEVVDFLDVWFGSYHYPTFNVADSAITVGVALLLWGLWRTEKG